ncbi:hypothetical protein [Enterococcus phage phiSHEF13]|uniref:Uncharacterized protein n=6 Tax=Schiekvirus TaxID=2732968 RepID=A0AAE9K967_9CAUD|nr:hypothetical protein [Enterococcus phage vB_OCPT_Ben]QNL31124.1 hypothetical protein A2_56 [Enterococcus phage vB_EfaM_A2]QYS24488.1 hypothetical protein [Enterococcus phage GVEsP-1]UKM17413.1 hypothetical protein [Enterococcus phage UTI-EfS3]UMO76748.1 hypothetical protein [Enterococcus phage phiSHEF13]UNZ10658.1 hypothetical protein DIEEDFHO_00050 [Enterococcus phage vB_OCPT_Bill]UPW35292.1 hypothetical protein KEBGJNKE_00053 [Enterococcus phage vB_OCPT_Bop]
MKKERVPYFIAKIIENAGGTRNDRAKEYVIRSVIDDYYKGNWETFVQDWFGEYCNILKFYRAVENGYEVD